ncbi:MAG: PEP-CTERM sorting domain-containing protein [Anaerolineae bacterium]|jgi:hypothetical protein|nr:PEP-CTERM sorting domain-containing protein [Anaerolineae bacterium]
MSRRSLIVLLAVAALLALTATAAFAQTGGTKQVGLVVTFPDGKTHTEVVTVPAAATAIDALRAAKLTVVTNEGSFGTSLCKVNETGCPADDCFCDPAKFWAYYHLTGSAWTSAAEGVGAFVPANGAVEGFAWSGFDDTFNPTVQPPVYTFEQLVSMQNPPVPIPEPATLLLLGGGVAALAGWARRKRGQKAA